MKSERRHELKTNSLVHGIEQLPEVGRNYGSRIALALVVALLAVVLVRLWLTSRTEEADGVAAALTQGRAVLASLRGDQRLWAQSTSRIAERRDRDRKAVEEAIGVVLKTSTDPARQAEAKILKGDLYWQLSSMAELPGATSLPADLRMDKSASALMDTAAEQYGEVLAAKDKLPAPLVASARFGLAAVAESRGNYDIARDHYEAVVADKNVAKSVHDFATSRLDGLVQLRRPFPFGQPRRPELATGATTGPTTGATSGPATSATLPVTQPTTGPATAPSIELLVPTTSPVTAPAAATLPGTTPGAP